MNNTIYEVYFGDGEQDKIIYPTSYFSSSIEAVAYAKNQIIHDDVTVIEFVAIGSIVDALNGKLMQQNRRVIFKSL